MSPLQISYHLLMERNKGRNARQRRGIDLIDLGFYRSS